MVKNIEKSENMIQLLCCMQYRKKATQWVTFQAL